MRPTAPAATTTVLADDALATRHAASVGAVRALFERRFPAVSEARPARLREASPDLVSSRFTFEPAGGDGLGRVIVHTDRVGAVSVWSDLLGDVSGSLAAVEEGLRNPRRAPSLDAATNDEVDLVHALADSLSAGERERLGSVLGVKALGIRRSMRLRNAVESPGTARRSGVLAVTAVLRDVLSGAPTEWVVRRVEDDS